jgi:hypothetical protein
MKNKTVEELVIRHLQNHCKIPQKVIQQSFGILFSIPESFGAIVIGERLSFINGTGDSFWDYPPLFLVHIELQSVSPIAIQYTAIDKIETIVLDYIKQHEKVRQQPINIKDSSAYKELIKVIKAQYPRHPKEKIEDAFHIKQAPVIYLSDSIIIKEIPMHSKRNPLKDSDK